MLVLVLENATCLHYFEVRDLQMMERNDTFFNVRGTERMVNITTPMMPHTIVQVACPVRTFIAIVNVRRCDAIQKTQYTIYANPKTSLPIGPRSTSPTSP